MKEQFINRYPLSKTLRFSLIPVAETENNFNKNLLLEKDKQRAENYEKVKAIRDYLLKKCSENGEISVNSKENSSPYVLSISVKDIKSEVLLHYLEKKEIYVSSGSACSKGAKSGVLDEFGLSQRLADSALRISLDFSNTKEEIDKFVDVLKEGQQKILKSK